MPSRITNGIGNPIWKGESLTVRCSVSFYCITYTTSTTASLRYLNVTCPRREVARYLHILFIWHGEPLGIAIAYVFFPSMVGAPPLLASTQSPRPAQAAALLAAAPPLAPWLTLICRVHHRREKVRREEEARSQSGLAAAGLADQQAPGELSHGAQLRRAGRRGVARALVFYGFTRTTPRA